MDLSIAGKSAFIATQGRAVDRSLPSIVFVHGAGLDHTVWTLMARYFVRHGRNVLAVDLPGHGRSQGPPLETISAMADWLAELMAAAGPAQTAIVGHSMGSLVALEVALRHPASTQAMALLGSSVPMPVNEQLLAAAKRNDHTALDMLNIWGHSYTGQIGGFGPPGLWKSGDNLRLLEKAAPGVVYAGLKACNDYPGDLQRPARVQCPTLLVIGDSDIMTPPREAEKLAGAIPAARTALLENCGHAMLMEQPNAILDTLIDFL